MPTPTLSCRVDARRRRLFGNPDWNGIDYVEVADDQRSLLLYFFGAAPAGLTADNVRIEGGRRIRGIRVLAVEPGPADDDGEDATADAPAGECLRVVLDRYGDFSTYRLCLVPAPADADGAGSGRAPAGIDPRYACVDFSFKVDCPNDFDCAAVPACPPQPGPTPDIDYLAKDYQGFRQLMLDRLATTMPAWRERHVPDLGITLVETMAFVADQLSGYQDAVATEAYIGTARTRISVRRHARLVDYRLHEGCNARAWLAIACRADGVLPADAYFVTAHAAIGRIARAGGVRESDLLAAVPDAEYEVFEQALTPPETGTPLVAAHSTLHFHTWGDRECCLPRGATRATLRYATPAIATRTPPADDDKQLPLAGLAAATATGPGLQSGDVLVFEEVLGPRTGHAADADPAHRHAVRLTRVTPGFDALLDQGVLEIEWAAADALPFPLCLSARLPAPDCRQVDDVSVAHGNVILVDHGRVVDEDLGTVEPADDAGECGCAGVVAESAGHGADFAPILARAPLAYRQPPPPGGPAAMALAQDPHRALPLLQLEAVAADTDPRTPWRMRADLIDSDGGDRDVMVEVDDDGRGHLRFGDDRLGRRPDAGMQFDARYRVGGGTAGNVAADAIAWAVFRTQSADIAGLQVRNPLAARGGIAPETLMEARLAAPHAFRATLQRAITAADYAALAQADPALQRAHARLAWSGSWYEADVALDPLGGEKADAALCRRIEAMLWRYRRVGHDLAVQPARYVPLAVALQLCVAPDYLRGPVLAAVADALGSGYRADGTRGFFHPDRLTFGDDVHASDLVAAVQAIDGVQSVQVLELRRSDQPGSTPPAPDRLELASFEIARLDNDPDFPEHGTLTLHGGGGR
jgi:hypothetical protein